MGSFAKKTTRNKRNRITRRKRRSSRKKCERHRYTKRGGDKPTTMSESLIKSFPIMTDYPQCRTCLEVIDKSSSKLKSPTKNKSALERKSTPTKSDSKKNTLYSWTDSDIAALGVPKQAARDEPNKIPTKSSLELTPLEDSPNFKTPSVSKKNPFRRKSISSK